MVRTEGIKLSRKDKKRFQADMMRSLRVIEYLDFSRIYDDSSVEVLEGYTVSDRETNEVFAIFKIQNTGAKAIKALSVRLLMYEGTSNIPTKRIDHVYSATNKNFGIRELPGEDKKPLLVRLGLMDEVVPAHIRPGEIFGQLSFIKLPHSYCRKIEFEIRTAYYTDGSEDVINTVSGKKYTRFNELGEDLRYAYRKLNVFYKAEEEHPIKIIPQATDRVWLCCCGRKNLNTVEKCVTCGRGKDWQLDNITEESLNTELDRIRSSDDPYFVHLHKHTAGKQLNVESDEDRKSKAEAVERAWANVAKQEQRKKQIKRRIIIAIIVIAIACALSSVVFTYILDNVGRGGLNGDVEAGQSQGPEDNAPVEDEE